MEEALSQPIKEKLEALGLSSASDEMGNLYVSLLSGKDGNIFLCSHMDTVPVPEGRQIRIIRKEGRISSDGTTILGGDDKQGVAAALEILHLCRENPGLHRSVEVIFTVKEEIGSIGGGALDPSRMISRDGFNLDGETAPGTVIMKAPRKEKFVCTVKGVSSHAALAPLEGINAIAVASQIITKLPLGEPGPGSTSNVGVIRGGLQTNIVPDSAVFEGELRSFSSEEFEDLKTRIDGICTREARALGGEVHLEWVPCYNSYEVNSQENCSRWFIQACEKQKIKGEFVSSRGGGDSNQLNNMGLRNLVFGLGMHNIHSVDEYLIEDEYYQGVKLLAQIIFPDSEII
jgi:tripeptide aminopeptidase